MDHAQCLRYIIGFLFFLLPFTALDSAEARDCNGNARPDADDLAMGLAADCNLNGVPDECDVVAPSFRELGRPRGSGTARAVFWTDLNDDGSQDLAMGTINGLSVWLAIPGAGVVDSEVLVTPLDGLVRSWAVGDLNGDGSTDAVGHAGSELRLLLNDGTGSFQRSGTVAVGAVRGNDLAVGDFDGDGTGDIALIDSLDDEVFFLWSGEPSPAQERYPLGEFPIAVAIGDIDADGALDIAVANRDSESLSLLYGRGDRTFQSDTLPTGHAQPEQLLVADLSADGLLDLVTSHWDVTSTMLNRGARIFTPSAFFAHEVRRPTALAAADLDADGDLDVIGPGGGTPSLDILWNRGDGFLNARSEVELNRPATAIRGADVDADGALDLVVARSGSEGIAVLGNVRFAKTARAAFASGVIYPQSPASQSVVPHGLTVADFDDDGAPDAAVVNGGRATIGILWNDGDGALVSGVEVAGPRHRLDAIAAGDLDADGDLDVVAGGTADPSILIVENLGGRRFGGPRTLHTAGGLRMLMLEDVDGDQSLDILSAHPRTDVVTVHWGAGDGSFAPALILQGGRGPAAVATADFDGDGDLDLASANSTSSSVTVFRNEGERTFTAAEEVLLVTSPNYVVTTDFDRDGFLDLATTNNGAEVQVLYGHGDGTLTRPFGFTGHGEAYSLLAVDVNRDGLPDLVTANEAEGTLSVLVNVGDRTFLRAGEISGTTGVRFADAADMDGDGVVDLVSGNRGSASVSVVRNEIARLLSEDPYRESICTALGFWRLGMPQPASSSGELTVQYVLPSRQDDTLLPTLFLDTERFPLLREFLIETFPERFEGLSIEQYLALVARRESRDYFVGSIHRVRTKDGVIYGFNVFVDESDPSELLREPVVRALRAGLEESFGLEPLVYLPDTQAARDAASEWDAPDFPVYVEEAPLPVPEPPAPLPTPTFALEIPEGIEACGVFSPAGATRGPEEEYDLKTVVRFSPGTVPLATASDSMVHGIVEELLFGPQQVRGESLREGVFEVRRLPLGGGVTGYRFTYAEDFVLPDGGQLQFVLAAPLIFRSRGEERLDGPVVLDEAFLTVNAGSEAFQLSIDNRPNVRFGSCAYAALPLFEIAVELEGGGSIRLEERFREAESLLATGPASLVRAAIDLAGETRVVTEYPSLVYSASRHNRWAQYRVFLDPPLGMAGLERPVHVVEVRAPEPFDVSREEVHLLDEDFERLDTPRILSYSKTERPAAENAPFRRGDVSADGRLNLTDVVALLEYRLARGPEPACVKSADNDDSGVVNLTDVLVLLNFLFRSGDAPSVPFEACGLDLTEDALDCAGFLPCRA